MKKNFPITGVENDFAADMHIVSTTDQKGVITSVNADFIKLSGFTAAASRDTAGASRELVTEAASLRNGIRQFGLQ